jgi:hypothetical protein
MDITIFPNLAAFGVLVYFVATICGFTVVALTKSATSLYDAIADK